MPPSDLRAVGCATHVGTEEDSVRTGRKAVPPGLTAAGIRSQRLPLLAAVALTATVTAGAIAVSAASDGIQVTDLMSDPAELTEIPWYLGAASSINLLVWAAGAALYVIAGIGLRPHDTRLGTALTGLGVLTITLTLDDLLLLHEIVIPWAFGLPQIVTFLIYGAGLLALLVHYRAELMGLPEVTVLVIAAFVFGGSVILDVLAWDTVVRRVAEETLKLLGATVWAAFPAAVIVRRLAGSRADGQPRDAPPRGEA
jgi:hypothetical protein